MTNRRKTTKAERLTACEVCGYGISQRHHLLEVAFWDENNATVQLCANCHELYHLMKNGTDNVYLGKVYIRLGIFSGQTRARIHNIKQLIERANELEKMATKEVIRMSNDLRMNQ